MCSDCFDLVQTFSLYVTLTKIQGLLQTNFLLDTLLLSFLSFCLVYRRITSTVCGNLTYEFLQAGCFYCSFGHLIFLATACRKYIHNRSKLPHTVEVGQQSISFLIYFILQGDQLNRVVFFWYLGKSALSSVQLHTLDKSIFTRHLKTRPCLTGHLVGNPGRNPAGQFPGSCRQCGESSGAIIFRQVSQGSRQKEFFSQWPGH